MVSGPRLPDDYFDELYAGNGDPWGFADRWYEQRKRDLAMAVLPRRRYTAAFEPGCSLGIQTLELASRCDRVLATDVSRAALTAAAQRLSEQPGVELRRWALGDRWPDERFDLVVLSEVLYYLQAPMLLDVLTSARDALVPGGQLLAVHWRHPVADYPLGGDDVHAALAAMDELTRVACYDDADVLIECYQRIPPEPVSVAAAEGLS